MSENKNKYYEITTTGNRRPGHPEDNTVILKAQNISHANQLYDTLKKEGRLLCSGEPIKLQQMFYFYETEYTS